MRSWPAYRQATQELEEETVNKHDRRNGINLLRFDEWVVRILTPQFIVRLDGRDLSEDAKYQLALEVVQELIDELGSSEEER